MLLSFRIESTLAWAYQQLVGRLGQADKSAAHHVANADRHFSAARGAGRPQQALTLEQAGQLADKERVALGAGMNGSHRGRTGPHADGLRHEAAHFRFAQAAERDAVQGRVTGQRCEYIVEWLGGSAVNAAVGDHQQDWDAIQPGGHEPGQLQRGGIRPMQVVEDQNQPPVNGDVTQEVNDRLVKPEASRRRIEQRGRRELGRELLHRREDGGDRTGSGAQRFAERLPVASVEDTLKNPKPRPVRRRAVDVVNPTPGHHGSLVGGRERSFCHD